MWLEGGASQRETWDPAPGSATGGRTKAVRTSVDGLSFSAFFPQVAAQAHLLSCIRSLVSAENDHERGTYAAKTGHPPDPTVVHPSLGAVVAYLAPAEALALPPHVSLCKSQWPAHGGLLGPGLDAFKVERPGEGLDNLASRVDAPREARRQGSLAAATGAFFTGRDPALEVDARKTLSTSLRLMQSEELAAFKLEDEPAKVRAAYGDTDVGRGCLVARRLLERGVPAVEVSVGSFDGHALNHELHRSRAADLDPALASLLLDLQQRELLRTTVVLVMTEFGRTPLINAAEGRDHWSSGFSCLVGGGGLRAGQVIGATDPSGERRDPADPVKLEDLTATVLTTLGFDRDQQLESREGRPIRLSEGTPLRRLA